MLNHKLSVVLPAHNEAENIIPVIARASEVLPRVAGDYELIVVNDGSTDGTRAIIDELARADPHVRVVHHEVNQGYGAALTSGFALASGHWIMFMDADRQFDIGDIDAMLPFVMTHDIVAGYRMQRQDPAYRRVYAKLFGVCVAVLFGVRMRDIDCAFKICRADVLHDMAFISPGALINTELLARARRRGATIKQVGVHHYPRPAGQSSGGSPRVIMRALGETARLWMRLRAEPIPARINADRDTLTQFVGR